jgi:hypothetical protein
VAFIEGEVKEVSVCASLAGVGLSYSMGISVKGRGCPLTDSQNGNIITIWQSFPHFFFNNDEGRD